MNFHNYGDATSSTCGLQMLTDGEDCHLPLKRKLEDEEDDGVQSKRISSWYISIPEFIPVSSGDESVYSVQGRETEFCQDTPDTSSDSESDGPLLELELESLSSEVENPFGRFRGDSSDSSTDSEGDIKFSEIVLEVKEDVAFWGDDSNTSYTSSSDPEIPILDYSTCLRCKCVNKPFHRYCSRCFHIRKQWFPPRPRHKPKNKKIGDQRKWTMLHYGSKDSSNSECESASKVDGNSIADKNSETFNSDNTQELETGVHETEVVRAINKDKCITCMDRPKDAVFVHGTVGHLCCCYQCAKKVWSNSGKCPVCGRKTSCVVKTFLA